jgi:CBS domain-containing protein
LLAFLSSDVWEVESVLVSEVMTREVVMVPIGAPLVEAARLMRDADIGDVPVNSDRQVVGVLTDRDITVRAIASGRDPRTTRVEEVMTPSVVSCSENDDVRKAAEIMQSAQLRRLLVLSPSGEVAGIVSLGDLALQARDEELAGETLEHISEPPPGR